MSLNPRRLPPGLKKDATPLERGLLATMVATVTVGTMLAFGAVTGQLPLDTCDSQGTTQASDSTASFSSSDCR
jgi:hypothetical protein